MSIIRFRIIVTGTLDTDDYHVPSDFNIAENLEEEIKDAIEGCISVEVKAVKANLVGKVQDEIQWNND